MNINQNRRNRKKNNARNRSFNKNVCVFPKTYAAGRASLDLLGLSFSKFFQLPLQIWK
jgi:hypothetical protein